MIHCFFVSTITRLEKIAGKDVKEMHENLDALSDNCNRSGCERPLNFARRTVSFEC